MSDVECPYCGSEQEICHDDGYGYSEDETHEQQCSSCDKYFAFTTSISYYYEAAEAPCMNGGDHDWKPSSTYPVKYTKMRCSYCDDRRAPTDIELVEIIESRGQTP